MRTHTLLASLVAVVTVAGVSVWAQAGAAPSRARSLPMFEVDRTWPNALAKWKLGDPSSFAVDARDQVWLLHRPRTVKPEDAATAAPPVVVFDSAGRVVKAWGGAGAGYEWPEREHGIHVDAQGFVWITGNYCPPKAPSALKPVSDDQILKFTGDGTFVLQIGKSNQSTGNADTRNVHRAADVWLHPVTNELFVADGYGNHRVAVFNPETGAMKRMWGAFGGTPMDDDHCELAPPATAPDARGPRNFSIVHALRVARDGMVYVADRENRRVQAFTADGTFVKQLIKADTTFARDLALSADAAQQFLYVGNGQDIAIVDRQSLEVVGSIAVPGMIGGGHHIATDSKGNLYIAQTAAGMQKLRFTGMSASGASQRQTTGALAPADREAIELLSARYALALGTCDGEKYADLFAKPDGWFASGTRGQVQGPTKLVALIGSYDCRYSDSGAAPPHAPGVEVPYKLDISATSGGASGTIYMDGGFYTDSYVKGPGGWRFASRSVITNKEHSARLSARDFEQIRRLAERAGGPYADVYEPVPGGWRFQSANVVVRPSADGASGVAYLAKDGGRYEDSYVRTAASWRFQARVYVPPAADSKVQLR